jgi:hypothetical protein
MEDPSLRSGCHGGRSGVTRLAQRDANASHVIPNEAERSEESALIVMEDPSLRSG